MLTLDSALLLAAGASSVNQYLVLALVVAAFVVPFVLGRLLASALRSPGSARGLGLILFALIGSGLIVYFGWPPRRGVDLKGGVILVYQVKSETDASGKTTAVDINKVASDIGIRLNQTGMENIEVRPYGQMQVEIIIPDIDQAGISVIKKKIETAGLLEFRIVANQRDHEYIMDRARLVAENPDVLRRTVARIVDENGQPIGHWVKVARAVEINGVRPLKVPLYGSGYLVRNSQTGEIVDIASFAPTSDDFWLENRLDEQGIQDVDVLVATDDGQNVTGDDLLGVRSDFDSTLNPRVAFSMIGGSAARFGALTGANLPDGNFKRQLGIVLDNELITAPNLNSRITDNGVIEGRFDQEEVDFLVGILRAGRLSATIEKTPISENQIGPVLGESTIRKGTMSIYVSLCAVLAFTAVYYRFAGLVACCALLANLLLTLALMILLKAPLTLPGLAGLVLTVGMSVDANVLIFERIREELDRGTSLRMAIRNGFSRATVTIVDANLTTLITAIVLYAIGTDQIKGFAVTLILGILMSMFTAIYCSRIVFDLAERRRYITALVMMRLVGDTKIDFLGAQRLALGVSTLLIVIGVVAVGIRGKGMLDIDFNGGTSVQMLLKDAMPDRDVRGKLDEVLAGEGIQFSLNRIDVDGKPANVAWKVDSSLDDIEELKALMAKSFRLESFNVLLQEVKEITVPTSVSSAPAAEAAQEPETTPPPASASPAAPAEGSVDQAKSPPANAPPSDPEKSAEPQKSVESPEGAEPQTQDEPAKQDGESGQASGDETLLPVAYQDAPPNEATQPPATADPSPPATVPQGSAGEPPVEPSPAAETPAATAPEMNTEALLDFGHPVPETLIRDRLDTLAKGMGINNLTVSLIVGEEAPDWRPGAAAPFQKWKLTVPLALAQSQPLLDQLRENMSDEPVWLASNKIGSKVASDMTTQAMMAMFASLIGIVAYIWFRFHRVVYGIAAVIALVHDVLITLGAVALSAYVANYLGFQLIEDFKISLPVVAAFLTLVGYSLNDTIVVFDRIREVRGKNPELTAEMINFSINQTLSRTLLTSLTTLLVISVLYVLGGQGIHSFAFSLLVGIVVGTYSSIFVASPALLWMTQRWESGSQRGKSRRAAA